MMFSSLAATLAIGLAVQIPPPGGGFKVPPIAVGPARLYLVAAGKPTLQVSLPPAPGMKGGAPGPLAAPTSPFRLRIALDENSVAWLKTLNRAPIFDGMIARCDSTGRVYEAYNLTRTRPNQLAFPQFSATTGGGAYFDITLAPNAVAVNKTAPPVAAPRSVSAMRVTGFSMKIKDKPLNGLANLLPFNLNLAATEYSSDMFFETLGATPPGSGSVGIGLLELRLQVMARAMVLQLHMKNVATSNQGPRRILARASGITFL